MSTNFDLAPPPVTFEGKTAVPIDISAIDARLTFDGATRTASGDVTLIFVVGIGGGPADVRFCAKPSRPCGWTASRLPSGKC